MTDLFLVDAQMKAASYSGMSRYFAESGHAWLAVHAQVSADLAAARAADLTASEVSLWADAEVATDIAASNLEGLSARDAVRAVRGAISAHLTDEAYEAWGELVSSLDHLDGLDDIPLQTLQAGLRDRFGGLSVEEYLALRDDEAGRAVWVDGTAQSISDQYDVDMAKFEAWLIRRSLARQDLHLTQYELLWSLGTAALASVATLPADPAQARHLVVSRLVWAVGPAEAPELLAALG